MLEIADKRVAEPYEEFGRAALALFGVYVVYWYLQVGERVALLGQVRAEAWLASAVLLVVFVRGFRLVSAVPLMSAVLLALIGVYTVFSMDPANSRTIFVDRVLKFCVMGLGIAAFVRGPTGLRFFLVAFMFAWLKIGQEGVVGQLTGNMVWQNQGVMRLHGSTSLYTHPNSLSGNAVGQLPFIYFLFPLATRRVRAVLLVQAAMAAVVILFTGSRTGYIAAGAFVLYAFWDTKQKGRFLGAAIALSLVCSFLVPPDYVDRFNSIFSRKEKEGASVEARLEILRDAWAAFLTYPLGMGTAAFPAVRQAMFGRTQDTHNLYLEVATNLGVHGLMAFIAFIAVMLSALRRVRSSTAEQVAQLSQRPPPEERAGVLAMHIADLQLVHATARAVQGFLVVRLIAGAFGHDLYEVYWWFSAGLATALAGIDRCAAEKTASLLAAGGSADEHRRPAPSR